MLRLPIGDANWSLKVSAGWPDDPPEDVEAGAWAGVVPMSVRYGNRDVRRLCRVDPDRVGA